MVPLFLFSPDLHAFTTPFAMVAQLTIPPKTLTRMAFTLESSEMMRKASLTWIEERGKKHERFNHYIGNQTKSFSSISHKITAQRKISHLIPGDAN